MEYAWDEAVVAEEIRGQKVTAFEYEPETFRPLGKREKRTDFAACVTDQVGTPRELVNSHGQVVWRATFTTWGELDEVSEHKTECPIRFQGQWWDEESGLCYNFNRYYDPGTAQYVSQDPIGLAGGTRAYGYVHNPLGWVDPWGLTGTYIFTDGTTSYIGKGPYDRMLQSMSERIGGSANDTQSAHMDFGDDKMGFMVEHQMMTKYDARDASNFANSPNRSSPGKRLYEAADAKTRAQVDANADALDEKFKASGVKASSACG